MQILWWRILVAAVALEVLYGIFILFVLGSAEQAYTVLGLSSVFIFMMFGGMWVGGKAQSKPILQGSLVGVAAVVFYTVFTAPAMLSGELVITGVLLLNHLLKIIGAAIGGMIGVAWFGKN